MRISDWSSDVCSSDLVPARRLRLEGRADRRAHASDAGAGRHLGRLGVHQHGPRRRTAARFSRTGGDPPRSVRAGQDALQVAPRSEEHTSELQSLMHSSYAVFCLKKKKTIITNTTKLSYL